MAQDQIAGDGAARSIQGAKGGLCRTTFSTTVLSFTVTEWAGRYVKISPRGNGIYYVFSAASAAGGLDITATATDAASVDATVPDYTPNDIPVQGIVPSFGEGKEVYLLVRTLDTSATADVRVRAA